MKQTMRRSNPYGMISTRRVRRRNVTNANAALDKIDTVYATFKPQHDKFLSDLKSTVLTPAQIETVKDVLTVGKVKFTYDVYLQIYPTLTDAQKTVVLKDLKDAREQAIDCESMLEKSAFFKKYKIKIEDDYLTSQGYDPKQARKDFAAKGKEAKSADAERIIPRVLLLPKTRVYCGPCSAPGSHPRNGTVATPARLERTPPALA